MCAGSRHGVVCKSSRMAACRPNANRNDNSFRVTSPPGRIV